MELRHFRYFLAVAEEMNFTRAAVRLRISQPPLSKQIRDLEEEIGTPLFFRRPSGVQLTDAGLAFLPEAKALLESADKAAKTALKAAAGETGRLRIGYTGSAAFHPRMAATVKSFRNRYPEVDLQLREESTAMLLAKIMAEEIDAAFVRPGKEHLEKVKMVEVESERMVLVLPIGFPGANGAGLPLKAIATEPLILFPRSAGPGFHDEIMNACRIAGFAALPGLESPQITSIPVLVAAGLGVSIVPTCLSQIRTPGVVYSPISGNAAPKSRFCLAFHDDVENSLVRNFLHILTSSLKK